MQARKRESRDRKNDAIGIVVVGLGVDGHGYVLADRTCLGSPALWGRRAVDAYNEFNADRIVAEVNFGGGMVESTIRAVDQNVAFSAVTASRSKRVRAEPISALYEQARMHHSGPGLEPLEDELCNMGADGYLGEGSPNRLDAMVWGATALMIDERDDGIIEFQRRESEEAQAAVKKMEALFLAPHPSAEAPPTDADSLIALICPDDVSTAYGQLGQRYMADALRIIRVTPEDAALFRGSGFKDAAPPVAATEPESAEGIEP
jgi:hypothetical protein